MKSRKKTSSIGVSLERAFSKLGLGSRAQAQEWILAGRVRVNQVVKKNPKFRIDMNRARLSLDNQPVGRQEPKIYLMNKPRGTVTTHSDEKGRKTVFDCAKNLPGWLHAVGRLDFATSGLLILTNQSRISSWLTDPLQEIPRVYLVTVQGKVEDAVLKKFTIGISDKGELLKALRAELLKASGKESLIKITLTEGKNREIRRMCASVDHPVTQLKRIQFGNLELGKLAPGETQEISVAQFLEAFPDFPKAYLLKNG